MVMSKMRVIDLLIKSANNEEMPPEIIYCGMYFRWEDRDRTYYAVRKDGTVNTDIRWHYCYEYNIYDNLNEEIEIPEDVAFEDIRELGIPEIDTVENERICRAEYRINALIRNQKKIISKLDKESDE